MATLNVFELTSAELSKVTGKQSTKESKEVSKRKKRISESARTGRKCRRNKYIPASNIRVESLRFVAEADENDEVIDYTPDNDVVIVIDPEMDETPETTEDAEQAAENLVGDYVYKCAICGANYVSDTEISEDEDGICPVCGESGEQVVVGEITPAEDVEDTESDIDDTKDISIDDEDFDIPEDTEDDVDMEEAIARTKRRTSMRRESRIRKPMKTTNRRPVKESDKGLSGYNLDEVTLNRMLTKFAKENYDNVRFVKITSVRSNSPKLTLEGTVTTTKGNKKSIKFVCENFRVAPTVQAGFKEIGVFTKESKSYNNRPPFIINFQTKNKTLTPVSLRYNYNVTERRNTYNVSGSVMNESINRTNKRYR